MTLFRNHRGLHDSVPVAYMGKVRIEMEELKPCPFCGEKAITESWASGGIMYMVKCGNPDCDVPAEGYPSGRNLIAVREQWNGRVNNERN